MDDDRTVECLKLLVSTLRNQLITKQREVKSLSLEIQRLKTSQQEQRDAELEQLRAALAAQLVRRQEEAMLHSERQMLERRSEENFKKTQRETSSYGQSVREVQEILDRQGRALVSSCARHIEEKDNVVEELKFENRRRDIIVATLKEQLAKAQQREALLANRIGELERTAACADDQVVMFQLKEESKLNAAVAMSAAQMDVLQRRVESLEKKLTQTEHRVREKDVELQELIVELSNRESRILDLNKKIQSMEFEVSLKNMNLMEQQKDRENSEQLLLSKLMALDIDHKIELEQNNESIEVRMAQSFSEAAEKTRELADMKRKHKQVLAEMEQLLCDAARDKREKEKLRQQIIDLEVLLIQQGSVHEPQRLKDELHQF